MAERPADPLELSLAHLDLRTLFHLSSNQPGVALAHAELLEPKVSDASQRARVAQVVLATVQATRLTRVIRDQGEFR